MVRLSVNQLMYVVGQMIGIPKEILVKVNCALLLEASTKG